MSTPKVMISLSWDGGHTWGHEQWFDLVGDDKNYLNRIVMRNVGCGYDLRFRIECSDNISFTLVKASADISVGI